MKQGRQDSFTARSRMDTRTVHRSDAPPARAYFPLPALRWMDCRYCWFLSSDTPDADARLASRAGFIAEGGRFYTRSISTAARLEAYADYRTKCELRDGALNPFDPFGKNPSRNDLLPGV